MARIGINILFLEPGKVGGTETFARELLNKIDQESDQNNQIILYCSDRFERTISFKNIKLKIILKGSNKIKRIFYEQAVLPVYLLFDRVNLVHSMGYTSPLLTHCPKITTIFDTQFISFPTTVSPFTKAIYHILMPLVAKFSSLIVIASEFARTEIVKNLKTDVSKTRLVYGGVNTSSLPAISRKKRKKYFLTSAASHPHKNLNLLIEFFILAKKFKLLNKFKLYITGFPGMDHENLLKKIKFNNLNNKIRFLGWIKESEKIKLMRYATAFIFPSVYEGFGLPPLEAMNAKTPVLSTNKASLKEVVGAAGIYIDPNSPTDLLKKVTKLITDDSLYSRVIKKGARQVKKFTWSRSYEQLKEVYKEVLMKSSQQT